MRRRELMLHAAGSAIGKARGNNWVKAGTNPMPPLGADGQFEIDAAWPPGKDRCPDDIRSNGK